MPVLCGLSQQPQRRYDMRHEMLTQRARFCIGVMAKKGTLSQHFVTHVVPPLQQPALDAVQVQQLLVSHVGNA